jgi:acyl-CoA synthetase (AMP-forming)/AMP-acid ligase II
LDEAPVEVAPFEKSFGEYRMKPWILLHTSGSTGIPKVITIRHGYTTTIDAYSRFGSEVKQRSGNLRLFNPFPPFHMSGIMWSLPIVIFIDSTIVLPPVTPLTAELANSVHEEGAIEYSSLPPSAVTELAKNVSKYTHLNTSYGATVLRPALAT